ncbi:sporulation protein YabP [Numidum massiliense]|uniref:sporulation protein YabP n=1 Tax=Numidum massiliense TaxID=1522315 RepID=UPI0006D543FC|nr:sporulation protein YabP [Numidum massiliense]
MAEQQYRTTHEIVMLNRNSLEVSGVVNVESFDSEEFLLNTECGYLAIRGKDLHIKTLNLEQGKVAIEGALYDIGYLDEGTQTRELAKGFFSKLFR